jgi:hypothetical protein
MPIKIVPKRRVQSVAKTYDEAKYAPKFLKDYVPESADGES